MALDSPNNEFRARGPSFSSIYSILARSATSLVDALTLSSETSEQQNDVISRNKNGSSESESAKYSVPTEPCVPPFVKSCIQFIRNHNGKLPRLRFKKWLLFRPQMWIFWKLCWKITLLKVIRIFVLNLFLAAFNIKKFLRNDKMAKIYVQTKKFCSRWMYMRRHNGFKISRALCMRKSFKLPLRELNSNVTYKKIFHL